MRLVELIPTADSDPTFVDTVMATMTDVCKSPIGVNDMVGLAVNHLLVIETIRLVEDGVCSADDIDAAFGLGPRR